MSNSTRIATNIKHISTTSNGDMTMLCTAFISEAKSLSSGTAPVPLDINSAFDFLVVMRADDKHRLRYSIDHNFLQLNPVAQKHIEGNVTTLAYTDIPEYYIKLINENFHSVIVTNETYPLVNQYQNYCRGFRGINVTDFSSVEHLKDKQMFIHCEKLIGKYAEYSYEFSVQAFTELALYFYKEAVVGHTEVVNERRKRAMKMWDDNPLTTDMSWSGDGWVLNYNNYNDYLDHCIWKNGYGRISISKEFGNNKAHIEWNDSVDRPRFEIRCSGFGSDGHGSSKRNVSLKKAMQYAEEQYTFYLDFVKRSQETKSRVSLAQEQMKALVPSDMILKFNEYNKTEATLHNNVQSPKFVLTFHYGTVDSCSVQIGSGARMTFAQVIEFYKMNSKFFL